jgi:hypothetical protein
MNRMEILFQSLVTYRKGDENLFIVGRRERSPGPCF